MSLLLPLADRLDDVRRLLTGTLPFSPLDYIPGLSLSADREQYAQELTRPLLNQDDLRGQWQADGQPRLAVIAERLPWDSAFFGYGVARLDGVFPLEPVPQRDLDYRDALGALLEQTRSRGIRYMFAVVDPRDLALLRGLGAHGFSLIETRMHYHYPLPGGQYVRLPDHLTSGWASFREATPDDIPSLAQVAREASNPFDRFHGDPYLAPADIDRLMETWVAESVQRRFADITIVPDVPNPRGFMTFRYHKDKWSRWGVNLIQAVFSATAPECLGWFAVVWPELSRYLRQQGAHYCYGKTQITLGLDQASLFGKGEHVMRLVL